MAGRLLPEMLQDMTNKAYPFEVGYTYTLPTGVFVDMLVLTTGIKETDIVYVRRLIGSTNEVLLYFGIHSSGGADTFMPDPIIIPKTDTSFNQIDFKCVYEDIHLEGHITTGVKDFLSTLTSDSDELTHTELPVYRGCVVCVDELTAGIVVNGTLMHKVVNLIAGEGIILTPTTITKGDIQEPAIEVSVASYIPPENTVIVSDDDLVKAIVDDIGKPITSINGMRPNTDGNFVIQGASANEALSVTSVSTSTGLLELNVPAVTACATDVQAAAAAFTTSVANLADRLVALDQFTTTLETAVNFLNQQLAQVR